jgi:hypothetical protein
MAVNRLEQMKEYQQDADINPMNALKTVRGEQGLQATEVSPMISQQNPMMELPDKVEVGSLHEILFTPSPQLDNDSLASLSVKPFIKKEIDKAKKEISLQDIGRNALGFNPDTATPQDGGLIGMAAGMPVEQTMPMQRSAMGGGIRNFKGQVPGQGHGMEDNVFMPIVERNRGQQVATLAVSPDEYVVDAHTMSALGNGSADAGAKVMDRVVKSVREKAYGTDQQPNEISGLAALRPMIERV